ncbi:MAG TPA: outer membrane protein [Xanthobacteraceae bacterium]|nr:outer membrane protein [Xanthobacteraceae bacterium]
MKKFVGVIGATLLFAAPAVAADLPVKAPVAPLAPVFSWSGCYVGADIGGAWSRQDVSVTTVGINQAPVGATLSGNNAIGGLYAGCNWQFAPLWVLGFEGDFSWTQLNDSATAPNLFADGTPVGAGGVAWSRTLDKLASLRGRLGFTVTPTFLLFATGGVAWARSDFAALDSFSDPVLGTGCPNCLGVSFTETKTGWVAGAGIDWAPWSNNWIVRLEYLHYQFDGTSASAFFPGTSHSANFHWGDLSVDSVRAGLAYKF